MSKKELLDMMKAEKANKANPIADGPYSKFYAMGSGGIINLFGPSKAGKTRISISLAIDAANSGIGVLYYDLEHNIHPIAIKAMKDAGVDYRSEHSELRSIRKEIKSIHKKKQDVDARFIIIDSLTLEITAVWGEEEKSLRDKLDRVSRAQNIAYHLGGWAEMVNGLAIIITQPISAMGDRKKIQPMGDKLEFFCKEIFWVDRNKEERPTVGHVVSWGSRIIPPDTEIVRYTTRRVGVDFNKFNLLVDEL